MDFTELIQQKACPLVLRGNHSVPGPQGAANSENISLPFKHIGGMLQEVNCHTHLIWMHNEDCLPIVLLDLVWSNQVCHANWFPFGFTFPKHSVKSRQ